MPTYLSPGVYVEEVEAGTRPIEGVGTSVAAFVGLAQKGPVNTPTLVANWTQFVETFGDFVPGSYLAHAVYGYYMNGGGVCYVVRIGATPTPAIAAPPSSSAKSAPKQLGPAQAVVGALRLTSQDKSVKPKRVTVEVADAGGENPPEDQFTLIVQVDGKEAERYDNVTTKRGENNVATKVNTHSKILQVEELTSGSALMKPDKGVTELLVAPEAPPAPSADEVTAADYIGDAAERTGFSGLEAIDDVTMVAVPDLVAALEQGAIDRETFKAVQLAIIAHCELMGDRMAILDPPPGLNAQQIKDWRVDEAGYDSKYATLYWPEVKVFDPSTASTRYVPPSGHVAGVWARSDNERGVHKAPANEVIRGAVELETQITRAEHDLLNPVGINCIRAFPGRGIRIWGARTLSSDPAWRYVNVRRLFNYLEESILVGTQWVVFEPNDDALWARIRRTIAAFLVNEWRKGALFGLTPAEAFYVQCDRETNPAEAIDAGQVTCRVGVAPVKPAEFVIFQLAQFSGGTSLVAE
ncbi:MAG TPA: phage tail protein [Micrococcales bacterium]|uniref:Phage tail sheath family protein n=1 Tax=Miniimonas arenae TaxID=676201 RepID=A0A5C5B9C2_9MICO|nr:MULTISPECIES: phage tail sheath subtilisin-like domain-containing protein [Miniimonas]TNU73301.1 phage tail sheath family protein [Miniimonas arenae]HCX84602.1 phage tail protein [Micrococcales bacterium]